MGNGNLLNNEIGKVSIIVPVYNSERFIDACLKSIAAQSYRDIEVIVIDDGSTDTSLSICSSIAENDERFHIISQNNAGVSSARNVGLHIAIGKWITFVDSDDVIAPGFLDYLLETATTNNAEMVVGGYKTICCENTDDLSRINKSKQIVLSPAEALEKMLYQNGYDTASWGKLYKHSLFDGVYFPDIRSSEDLSTIYRTFFHTNKVVYVIDSGYRYRLVPGSLSYSSSEIESIDTVEAAFMEMIRHYPSIECACNCRKLSYYSHLLGICTDKELSRILWNRIKSIRKGVLWDTSARGKTKIAAVVTYLGIRLFRVMNNVSMK